VVAVGVVAGVFGSVAAAAVIGPTPQAAALADTKKFAEHEVHAWNRPSVTYTVGSCRLLHRRPWLAYSCDWKLHGIQGQCLTRITVAVKRLADGSYSAAEVDTKIITNSKC